VKVGDEGWVKWKKGSEERLNLLKISLANSIKSEVIIEPQIEVVS
jgi:hypothetical protein